jgi:hypothetical protein
MQEKVAGYKLKREPENKYHANAVSMHDRDSDRKVGYIQRKYADKLSPIMSGTFDISVQLILCS